MSFIIVVVFRTPNGEFELNCNTNKTNGMACHCHRHVGNLSICLSPNVNTDTYTVRLTQIITEVNVHLISVALKFASALTSALTSAKNDSHTHHARARSYELSRERKTLSFILKSIWILELACLFSAKLSTCCIHFEFTVLLYLFFRYWFWLQLFFCPLLFIYFFVSFFLRFFSLFLIPFHQVISRMVFPSHLLPF